MTKTFADIKRQLIEGAELTMIRHDWYPQGKLIGVKRKIIKRQSNGIQFEGGSWWHFPPASDVAPQDNGFAVVLSIEKGQFMEYVIH
jgi:hypothetical protein